MNFYGLKQSDNNDQLEKIYFKKNNLVYSIKILQETIDNEIHWYSQIDDEFNILENETLIDAIFLRAPVYQNFKDLKQNYCTIALKQVGGYHPRIFRPFLESTKPMRFGFGVSLDELKMEINKYPTYHPNNIEFSIKSLTQLTTLKRMLNLVFSNIYPSPSNLETYGHTLKDLIILACIEIENQLKGVYYAHKINPKDKPYFNNYYELKKILRLDEYFVTLPLYPELPSFSPFQNWTIGNKKNSTPEWYDAYNGIKHNQDNEFIKATLRNAISAVCALAIILKAQYGDNIPYWEEEIGSFLDISNSIEWPFEEHIIPPFKTSTWEAIKINF